MAERTSSRTEAASLTITTSGTAPEASVDR